MQLKYWSNQIFLQLKYWSCFLYKYILWFGNRKTCYEDDGKHKFWLIISFEVLPAVLQVSRTMKAGRICGAKQEKIAIIRITLCVCMLTNDHLKLVVHFQLCIGLLAVICVFCVGTVLWIKWYFHEYFDFDVAHCKYNIVQNLTISYPGIKPTIGYISLSHSLTIWICDNFIPA